MKKLISRIVALISSLLLLKAAVAAQGASDPALQGFEDVISLAKEGLPKIQALVPWLVVLLVATIILGASSSVLQAFSRPWVKPATVVIGAVVVLIGSLKATFYAIDYATCNQTISDMRGLIQEADNEIKHYQVADLPPNDKIQYLKQIQGNVDTLIKLDNLLRASGHSILPPSVGLITVVHAQNQSSIGTISQAGRVISSTRTAGFEFAKYQALEGIASGRIKPPPAQLNAVIHYLNNFSQPAGSTCTASGGLFDCTYNITLASIYLNPSVLLEFKANYEISCSEDETGGKVNFILQSTDRAQVKLSAGQKPSFVFQMVANNKEWELTEIDAFRRGLWIFEFHGAHGATASFPLRAYEGTSGNGIQYKLPSPYPLHLPSGTSSIGAIGCQPAF